MVGRLVTQRKIGDRVGIGAQVHCCDDCECCSNSFDQLCQNNVFTYNSKYKDGCVSYGGYADGIRLNWSFTFTIPDALPSDVAAPLLCAGATVYNPLKRYGTTKGMVVGVAGIGKFTSIYIHVIL